MTNMYGARTLLQALEAHAQDNPDRLYASVPLGGDIAGGFRDVSCKDMAQCVDHMATIIVGKFGQGVEFETIAYIGIPDLRGAIVFLGAVKAGYKVLLPSPRNPSGTNLSLMAQTSCVKLLFASEVTTAVKAIESANSEIRAHEIPSQETLLIDDPIVILHSSRSTGVPKPITMTHATFAVLDRERNLPKIPGRKNRDYSIWDLEGGGRFYTVFPYFHLAGFLSLIVNPIFTEASSPVLGPPLMPPNGTLLKEVMKQQQLRALYLPPSIAENLLSESNGLEFFRGLDFLCYTGAPFSPQAGKQLSNVTELCPLYGSTEAFQIPQLSPAAPEDWAWMEWNPCFKVSMQPSNDEVGAYEAVLTADSTTAHMSALNHNLPGVTEYRTRDLFKQHPTKPGLWQYYSRRDDIIVLSNGVKFNPIPMELILPSQKFVSGALVVGAHKEQPALLLEIQGDLDNSELLERLWPAVREANDLIPTPGRIMKNMILFSSHGKPFVRAGKGTVVRRLTEKLYDAEIEELYPFEKKLSMEQLNLEPDLPTNFVLEDIRKLVRVKVLEAAPDITTLTDHDDLFVKGMDSIKTGRLLHLLKKSLSAVNDTAEPHWLDAKAIFQQSTILVLANYIYSNIRKKTVSTNETELSSRECKMTELLEEFTSGLTPLETSSPRTTGTGAVALIGSTGFLGPQILKHLILSPDILSVYCLNRSEDAKERTLASVSQELLEQGIDKVQFFRADIGEPKFGLDESSWESLSSNCDHIVFNAWNPNFSLPIQSFRAFLQGLRTSIDMSVFSHRKPHIIFVSSVAAIGSWPHVHDDTANIPEKPATANNQAIYNGYGESKCVGEQILTAGNKFHGIPVSIVRAGQIGGFECPTAGIWPRQGWLYSLFQASQHMGSFPESVAPLDWIPVDTFARGISNLCQDYSTSTEVQVYNMVHPKPVSWRTVYSVLTSKYGLTARVETLPSWLDHLAKAAHGVPELKEGMGISKIYNFLRSLGHGREFNMACDTDKAVSVLGEVIPLDDYLLEQWFKSWAMNLHNAEIET